MAEIKEEALNTLDDVLIEIINCPGPWKEKAQEIKTGLSEDGRDALEEFVMWFEEDE